MQLGTGEAFRTPTWLERTAAALRKPLAHSPFRVPLKRLYEAVLDRLPGEHLVSRFPGGETVRVAARFRQVTWNADEYRAFKADIRAGDVVLDVGANLGAYSLLFAQWAGPSGRVYAFEPAPETRLGLQRHVHLNQLASRITVRPEAVSGGQPVVSFRASGLQGDNRILGEEDTAAAASIHVPATTIDAFCAANGLRPSFIKIDVEGAELDALRGGRETIAAGGDALHLYVEMHPRVWASSGASREQIEQELHRQRLVAERLDGSHDVWGLEGVCLRLRRCEF
jgi:FkbM family methyltransferase